ncbi:hypothetical protein TNCV_1381091 [Trichonephila clavipes]|nr:hypothetical protein TNCV_1381091 [Trichonephila clavipes]
MKITKEIRRRQKRKYQYVCSSALSFVPLAVNNLSNILNKMAEQVGLPFTKTLLFVAEDTYRCPFYSTQKKEVLDFITRANVLKFSSRHGIVFWVESRSPLVLEVDFRNKRFSQ